MTFYIVHNTEDGIRIDGPMTSEVVLERLIEEDGCTYYGRDIEFATEAPDAYTPENLLWIIKAETVLPQPVEKVTEWTL